MLCYVSGKYSILFSFKIEISRALVCHGNMSVRAKVASNWPAQQAAAMNLFYFYYLNTFTYILFKIFV